MTTHPYISGSGNIAQMIGNLKRNFPASVTSETVKKFGLAPNNESYVINALQFIGVLDSESKRTDVGHKIFLQNENDFPSAFEELVRNAYTDLFETHGEDAWALDKGQLTTYFRTTDKTSEIIGGRQAAVFIMFRGLSGREQPSEKLPTSGTGTLLITRPKPQARKTKTVEQKNAEKAKTKGDEIIRRNDVAMTVRIEINLPSDGSQDTYDAIFKSIRANLINE